MSSQKHCAGKVLHNQMGFPPSLPTLFYTRCQKAHWGFDADTGFYYTDLFALMMYCRITQFLLMGHFVQHKKFTKKKSLLLLPQLIKTRLFKVHFSYLWLGQRDSVFTSNVANQPTYQIPQNAWLLHSSQKMIFSDIRPDCVWHYCEISWFQLVCTTSSNSFNFQHKGENTQFDIKQGDFGYPQFPQLPVPLHDQFTETLAFLFAQDCAVIHWERDKVPHCCKKCAQISLCGWKVGEPKHFSLSSWANFYPPNLNSSSLKDAFCLKATSCCFYVWEHWHLVVIWRACYFPCILSHVQTSPDNILWKLCVKAISWRIY